MYFMYGTIKVKLGCVHKNNSINFIDEKIWKTRIEEKDWNGLNRIQMNYFWQACCSVVLKKF